MIVKNLILTNREVHSTHCQFAGSLIWAFVIVMRSRPLGGLEKPFATFEGGLTSGMRVWYSSHHWVMEPVAVIVAGE